MVEPYAASVVAEVVDGGNDGVPANDLSSDVGELPYVAPPYADFLPAAAVEGVRP